MAGVAKKSPQAHQNRAGTDGSAVGPLGLAFKSCLLCPESDRAVDARAEIHVNSSRHAARVAPEILHRTEGAAGGPSRVRRTHVRCDGSGPFRTAVLEP